MWGHDLRATMAFLVKPVNGDARRMELTEIHDALKQKAIAENWLVRDERQDFWYSVGKLVGTTASQPVTLFCPQCAKPIAARKIDIGLPATCQNCNTTVIVPDPLAAEQRQRNEHLFLEVRRNMIFGVIALSAGAFVTLGSYFTRERSSGTWVLWWGPLAIGLGLFVGTFPRYLELKRKLKRISHPASRNAPPNTP